MAKLRRKRPVRLHLAGIVDFQNWGLIEDQTMRTHTNPNRHAIPLIVPSDFSDSILRIFACNASNYLQESINIRRGSTLRINPWEKLRDDRLFVLKLLVRT